MMLHTDTAQGVCRLTLARAQRGNALCAELVDVLTAALDTACANDSIHTLVLSGDGANFCTGFDLGDPDTQSDGDLLQRFVRIEILLGALWHAPMRTVALARGRTWGAGADLFACCDVRAAVPGTTFRFPGAGFGVVLGTRRLVERIGADRARRCVSEGLTLDAVDAHVQGLVTELVDCDPDAWLAGPWAAPAVDRHTATLLRCASRPDHRDADLAALVRSAACPGLRQRLAAYRARLAPPGRGAPT